MIPAPILEAALAAYAATPGTSRMAMQAALEAAFAVRDALDRERRERIWPMVEGGGKR